MHESYLSIGAVEVLNAARTEAYVKAFLPRVQVLTDSSGLRTALGHPAYTAVTGAPWYKAGTPETARFYGLLPGRVQGAEDSTRSVQVTELSGNGAVATSPRHGSREIRFTATAFAADDEAMEAGMAWLRQVLGNDGCSDAALGCTGRVVEMFTARPATTAEAAARRRRFYDVETTEGPLVGAKLNSKAGTIWEVEFTLTAGVPWVFTVPAQVGTLAMDAALNWQDPAGEDCSLEANAYDEFIDDPFFTGIARPPRPPAILPPNIMTLTSWRRLTLGIPASVTQRWGQAAPVVTVTTGAAMQHLRLRFYRSSAGVSGCDYDGEVIVSYLPANAILTLDAITREATVQLADGRTVPAGHLLFGSAGRPFVWPSLGCQYTYTMTADLMPGQSGVSLLLETAVRE